MTERIVGVLVDEWRRSSVRSRAVGTSRPSLVSRTAVNAVGRRSDSSRARRRRSATASALGSNQLGAALRGHAW